MYRGGSYRQDSNHIGNPVYRMWDMYKGVSAVLLLRTPPKTVFFPPPSQKCPFEAINIINLPSNLEKDTTHRYSANSFKLHRLPMPRPGVVLGLVGTNGIGKSTALKILAGKQKPNLGKFAVSVKSVGSWMHEVMV